MSFTKKRHIGLFWILSLLLIGTSLVGCSDDTSTSSSGTNYFTGGVIIDDIKSLSTTSREEIIEAFDKVDAVSYRKSTAQEAMDAFYPVALSTLQNLSITTRKEMFDMRMPASVVVTSSTREIVLEKTISPDLIYPEGQY